MKLDLKSARKELKNKTCEELEYETAEKWLSKAIVAYQLAYEAKEKDNKKDQANWLAYGDTTAHEALEHASLVMDYGKTVGEVQKKIEELRSVAEE